MEMKMCNYYTNNVIFIVLILTTFSHQLNPMRNRNLDKNLEIECSPDGNLNSEKIWMNIIDTDPEGEASAYSTKHIKDIINITYPEPMANYFKIDMNPSTKMITFNLTRNFSSYESKENLTQIHILAEFECESGNYTNMYFIANITDTNNNDPLFRPNPLAPVEIFIPSGEGTPIVPLFYQFGVRDYDLTTHHIEYGIQDNPYFNITTGAMSNEKKTTYFAIITVKKPLMEMKDSMVLNISATDVDLTGHERRTVYQPLTIIPDPHSVIFPTPTKFSQTFYKGYLKNRILEIDHVKYYDEFAVEFSLTGDGSQYFTMEVDESSNQIEIKFNENTHDDTISENNNFIFTVDAINEYEIHADTVIFVEIIKEHYDGGNLHPVYFGSYYFENETVNPAVMFKSTCDYNFTLISEYDTYFNTKCEDERVHLIVKKPLPVEIALDNQQIAMEVNGNNNRTNISTIIVVNLILQEFSSEPLRIIEIEEERPCESLVEPPHDNCRYTDIIKTWPEVAKNWFDVNNGKISTKGIDREHPAIAFLNVSQVQLEIKIDCPYVYLKHGRKSLGELNNTRFWINTGDVEYSLDRVMLNVIVKDINDNPPLFQYNSNTIYLNYPISTLTNIIRPQNLGILQASDADIGTNAKIKYTTENNKFTIHPDTGVIQPVSEIFSLETLETINFQVTATDGDGNGVHSTDINIEVKPLDAENIMLLILSGNVNEDPLEILSDLSKQISHKLILISSAILPNSKITGFNKNLKQIKNDNFRDENSLTMFVYGLDNDNRIVSATSISKIINEETDSFNTIAEPFVSNLLIDDCDTKGLVIAVSLLGAILLLFLVVIVLLVVSKRFSIFSYREFRENSFVKAQ